MKRHRNFYIWHLNQFVRCFWRWWKRQVRRDEVSPFSFLSADRGIGGRLVVCW
jgi:hypothetical protein